MLHNNFEVHVLVKGRPINEYAHNGQTFVEGRDKSNFEIEFRNLSPNRVEAVFAVDGLSVIDGEEAGPESSGYVVEPYQTLRIPGWKLSDKEVAAFQFIGKKKSYATQSTGSARNTGVLGVLVFKEKPKQPAYTARPTYAGVMRGGSLSGVTLSGGDLWNGTPTFGMASSGGLPRMMKAITLENTRIDESVTINNTMAGSGPLVSASLSATASTEDYFFSQEVGRGTAVQSLSDAPAPVVEQTLGTAFGEAQDFATTEVSFTRGDLVAMLVLYYDDSRGLRARGIELVRPSKQHVQTAEQPQAFPGMAKKSCTPPTGWKG